MQLRATLALLPALLLTGCALVDTHTPELGTTASSVKGTVIGGQQPVANATVNVYEVGTSGYGTGASLKASTTTDASGNFSFSPTAYTCSSSNAPMYIVATGGNSGSGTNSNLALISSLGACSNAHTESLVINEVSTAVTVFSMAQFFGTTLGAGVTPTIGGPAAGGGVYTKGLVAAMNRTVPALLDIPSGMAKSSSTSGNITTTIETAKINSIANVLAACVNTAGQTSGTDTATPCGQLFAHTTPPGGSTRPADTIQAALMMALYPYQNVSSLYNLSTATPPFVGLSSTPNDWTVAVSYADSALGVGVNGTAPATSMNMDIDATGRPWFTSTKSGSVGLAYFDPATQSFNGPYNAASGGVTHPQYIAIDTGGIAWASDENGSALVGVNTTSPASTSTLTVTGATSIGPVMVDHSNLLTVLYRNSSGLELGQYDTGRTTLTSTSVTTGANLGTGLTDETSIFHGAILDAPSSPCSLWADGNGFWAQKTSTGTNCSSGGASPTVVPFGGTPVIFTVGSATTANALCDDYNSTCSTPAGLNAPEGVATDGNDNLWVANSGNGSILTVGTTPNYTQIATSAYLHDSTHGGTLTKPYALAIDFSGNVWTVSPGCVDTTGTACTPGAMVLTELVGAAGPSTTPLSAAMVNSQAQTTNVAGANGGIGYKPQS